MGDKQCGIQESEVSSVCSSDTLLSLSGVSSTCSLDIARVTRDMHGGWMCLLNEIEQFDSVKTIVRVEVGVPAKVGWITHTQEGLLHLVEGEEKEIVCGATDGYPHADFAWTSYRSEDRTLQTRNARMFNQHEDEFPDDSPSSLITNRTGKAIYSLVPGSHLYSGSQSLLYRGSLSDNGTIILCRVQQSAADGAVLYTSTVQLQLLVDQLIVSQSMAMEERIGIISGIILAIIFIILMFIMIALFLTKRRKQKAKYSSVPNKLQDDLLTPIWIAGKESQSPRHVSSARQFGHDYHEEGDVQGLGASSQYSKVPTITTEVPEHSQDVSLDSSRPTTKTISDSSDYSFSSMLRQNQIESYQNFQSDLHTHINRDTDHAYSQYVTIDSDTVFSDTGDTTASADNSESCSKLHETHFGDSFSDIPRTVIHSPISQDSLPHGDYQRTVMHSPFGQDKFTHSDYQGTVVCTPRPYCDYPKTGLNSPLAQDSLSHDDYPRTGKDSLPHNDYPRTGKTIFDCELGCFVTLEEYQRRQKERQSK